MHAPQCSCSIIYNCQCMEATKVSITSWMDKEDVVCVCMYIYIHIHSHTYTYNEILLLLLLSRFSRVWLCATPQTAAHQASCPWDSPGKNTGVGCHFLLRCMKVKSESEVAQSCPTLSDPMDCSLPGSSVHGIFQARVLEWGAIAFSEWDTTQPQKKKWRNSAICNNMDGLGGYYAKWSKSDRERQICMISFVCGI